jgi:ABC-type antimicrobial peptide transport system permease subunit
VFPQRPTLFVRADADKAAVIRTVRAALQTLQSDLPAVDVRPVSDNVAWFVSPLRLGAAAFTAFGLVAAIVGAVGLYSVLAFLILEQRRAHAIRLAVGAAPASLARSVMGFALGTVLVGMAMGYAVLVPLARVLEPLLYHTRALEPVAVLAVVSLGAVTALGAAFFPMRAVLRTDVMAVLREQ